MPKVTINEIDQSRYVVNSQRAPLIALTPVISSWGSTQDAVLVQSESEFKNYFGTPLVNTIEGDITRNYALNLINSGVSLLAKRIAPTCDFSEGKSAKLDDLYSKMGFEAEVASDEKESIDGYVDSGVENPTYIYVVNTEEPTVTYICRDTRTGETIRLAEQHLATSSMTGALEIVPDDTTVTDYQTASSTELNALLVVAQVTLEDVNEKTPTLEVEVGDYVKFVDNNFVAAEQGDTGALEVVTAIELGKVSIYTVNQKTPTLEVTVGDYVKIVTTDTFDPDTQIHISDVKLDDSATYEVGDYVIDYNLWISYEINEGQLVAYTVELTKLVKMSLNATARYFGTYGNKIAINVVKSATNDGDVLKREPKQTVTITTSVVTLRTDAVKETKNFIYTSDIKSNKVIDTVVLRYDDEHVEDYIGKLYNYLDEFTMLSSFTITKDGEGDISQTEYVGFINAIVNALSGQMFILEDGNDYFVKVVEKDETTGEETVVVDPTTAPLAQFYRTLAEVDSNYTESDMNSINAFWNDFRDPYIYDFDFICASGFYTPYVPDGSYNTEDRALHSNMLKLANARGDAVACLDASPENDHNQLLQYFERLSNSDTAYSYGTTHGPWCKIRDITTGNYLLMPGSFIFLATIGMNLARNGESQIWYAPAGVSRASTNLVVEPQYEIGATILNEWQNNVDDIDVRINPIMKILSYGYVIYGNSTLMQDEDGYSKSALQSLGTRVLCNVVKKAIFSICVALTFEPNDYILWAEFKTRLSTTLDQMKVNGGITDYQIVMDETTVTDEAKNNLTVPGKVFISPTRPAEFFDIDFTITQAGVTFDESKSDVIG